MRAKVTGFAQLNPSDEINLCKLHSLEPKLVGIRNAAATEMKCTKHAGGLTAARSID
jgi:hypothetical protein